MFCLFKILEEKVKRLEVELARNEDKSKEALKSLEQKFAGVKVSLLFLSFMVLLKTLGNVADSIRV